MSILDIFKAGAIKKENETLRALIQEMGAGDALAAKAKIVELKNTIDTLQSKESGS